MTSSLDGTRHLTMYFKNSASIMSVFFKLIAVFFVFASGTIIADKLSATLAIEPSRCIALQQGQACFANLKFQWTNPAPGDYCLFDDRQRDPLLCWAGNTITSYKLQFKARKNVSYEIRKKSGDQPLAQALVKISWVYKSNTSSTSRWRLF